MVMVHISPSISKDCLLKTPAISALVIAIQIITKHCKKLKYKRKIVLVTDGRGSMDADDISQITEKIKSDEIELVVMYAAIRELERMRIDGLVAELILTTLIMDSRRKTRILKRYLTTSQTSGICS